MNSLDMNSLSTKGPIMKGSDMRLDEPKPKPKRPLTKKEMDAIRKEANDRVIATINKRGNK